MLKLVQQNEKDIKILQIGMRVFPVVHLYSTDWVILVI